MAVTAHDLPVAFALLEPGGHLDQLYCHPDHSRRGLANAVLNAAEVYARMLGMTQLFTEASELARPAFERAEYIVENRRDFTIAYEGREIPIHNYAMAKPLR